MRMVSMVCGRGLLLAAAFVFCLGHAAQAGTIVVPSNNGFPGDTVNGTGTNSATSTYVPVDSTGWYYSDVRSGATIGIRTALPYNGNGSVVMYSNGSNAKADIAYAPGTSLGLLKDVNAFSYSWYRGATSTVDPWLAPSLRLLLTDNQGHSGSLIWEPVYNGYPVAGPPVPTNAWVTSDAFNGGNGVFWTSGGLPFAGGGAYLTFADWVNAQGLGSYSVVGISSGVGSGWSGTFYGAVDNITLGFTGGTSTTFNFEVVPEPSSVALSLIASAAGLVEAIRRRRSR